MKITKQQLKQIIREELRYVLESGRAVRNPIAKNAGPWSSSGAERAKAKKPPYDPKVPGVPDENGWLEGGSLSAEDAAKGTRPNWERRMPCPEGFDSVEGGCMDEKKLEAAAEYHRQKYMNK